MKYLIIERTPNSSEEIDSFDTIEEAQNALDDIKDPDNTNPYYDDLIAMGGYLMVEDENGGGY